MSALFLGLLLAAGTPEAPQAPRANSDLGAAESAMDNAEWEWALEAANVALTSALTDEEEVRAYSIIARVHIVFQRDAQAAAAFENLLQVDPTWRPEPDASPKVFAAFEPALKKIGGVLEPKVEPTVSPPSIPPPVETTATVPAPAWYSRWWLWTAVGVVVAGAAVGVGVGLASRPSIPSSPFAIARIPP